MAWETRGGQRYYYRKVRNGARVVSVYMGGGISADMAAAQDEETRESARAKRQAEQQERRPTDADRAADEAMKRARILADGVLLLAGLRCHRGQWRRPRRRGGEDGRNN